MHVRICLSTFVLAILLVSFTACKKSSLQGSKGDQGNPGTREELTVEFLTVNKSDWQADTIAKHWKATMFTDKINDNVVANGMINVYFMLEGKWQTIPYTESDEHYHYGFRKSTLVLVYGDSHGNIPDESPQEMKIKLVISTGE